MTFMGYLPATFILIFQNFYAELLVGILYKKIMEVTNYFSITIQIMKL